MPALLAQAIRAAQGLGKIASASSRVAVKAHTRVSASGKAVAVQASERTIARRHVVAAAGASTIAAAHYGRNAFNEKASPEHIQRNWQLLPVGQSAYHMMGPGNEANAKYVSKNGHSEAVINPITNTHVTDPRNRASFNYFSPHVAKGIPHAIADVVPYMLLGNSPRDMLTADRFKATAKAVKSR